MRIRTYEALKTTTTMNTEVYYYGIADSKGIESFILDESYGLTDKVSSLMINGKDLMEKRNRMISMLALRASANPHRSAVVYSVTIKSSDAKEIEALLNLGKYIEAFKFLKKKALHIHLHQDPNALEYWNSIG